MESIVSVISGAVAGILGFWIGYLIYHKKPQDPIGTLRIDTSDPDGPYLFLELHAPVNEVMRKHKVTLNVSTESYISQN